MYSGVPKIIPVLVSFRPGAPSVSISLILAMPKSTILTKSSMPSRFVRKMFSGLMSRWTMPLACVAESARQHCEHDVACALGVDRGRLAEDVAEVLAFEELHDEVARAARRLAEVEDVDDVLVADARRALGFLAEARDDLGSARELVAKHLDGDALVDVAVEARVDEAHAALADPALDDQIAAGQHGAEERVVSGRGGSRSSATS